MAEYDFDLNHQILAYLNLSVNPEKIILEYIYFQHHFRLILTRCLYIYFASMIYYSLSLTELFNF